MAIYFAKDLLALIPYLSFVWVRLVVVCPLFSIASTERNDGS
jgi:hypothetical protein